MIGRGLHSERLTPILEARRRGIAVTRIATNMGVSKQCVQQIIIAHEIRSGEKLHRSRQAERVRKRQASFWACASCGKTTSRDRKIAVDRVFCSYKCAGDGNRILSDEDILAAIEMRKNQQSWLGIQKMFSHSYQSIQMRIWHLLSERGLMKKDVVHSIWNPRTSHKQRSPAWRWLINATGIQPN